MKKLLLSSVMMLFLCAVSFAQTEKLATKLAARTEASKQAQQAQSAREQEKILEIQNAKTGSNPSAQPTPEATKKMIAQKLAREEARNKTNAALTDLRAN